MLFIAGSRRDELCDQLNSAGNLGTGNRVNISNGSSQSARKNTASVSAELIANSTTSSLSRARDMTCNANQRTLFSGLTPMHNTASAAISRWDLYGSMGEAPALETQACR